MYTRRDDPDVPERVDTDKGFSVVHVPAGPACRLPKDDLLQHMPEFGRFLVGHWAGWRPDVVHAHFWMSGLATMSGAAAHHIPAVQTFHALGVVKRLHQGVDDTSPDERVAPETRIARRIDWVAATCSTRSQNSSGWGERAPRSRWCRAGSTSTSPLHGAPPRRPGKPIGSCQSDDWCRARVLKR